MRLGGLFPLKFPFHAGRRANADLLILLILSFKIQDAQIKQAYGGSVTTTSYYGTRSTYMSSASAYMFFYRLVDPVHNERLQQHWKGGKKINKNKTKELCAVVDPLFAHPPPLIFIFLS